jgi:RNA polymerase sigma factor (sigma-70 family)
MESSASVTFLDPHGRPFSDHIQRVLNQLLPRLRRKFPVIRDEVILIDILEEAGQQIRTREQGGAIEHLYGFGWVTVRNVAISRLRRTPELLEWLRSGSAEALAELPTEDSSPEATEYKILLGEILAQLSSRARFIVLRKTSGFSSREIADELGISVSSVDTTFSRARQKARKLLGPYRD